MIRTKNPDRNDGGAFGPGARPPVSELSERFATLFTELDDLKAKIGHTESEHRELVTNWGSYAEEARKADGRATAESGRVGTGVVVTDAAEALAARKTDLEHQIDAYRAALPLVLNDLAAEREKAQANLTPYRKAEDRARARMRKALDELDAAARELTSAVATREWITHHLPWEGEAHLDISAVWPPAARLTTGQAQAIPVRVSTTITALKGL